MCANYLERTVATGNHPKRCIRFHLEKPGRNAFTSPRSDPFLIYKLHCLVIVLVKISYRYINSTVTTYNNLYLSRVLKRQRLCL